MSRICGDDKYTLSHFGKLNSEARATCCFAHSSCGEMQLLIEGRDRRERKRKRRERMFGKERKGTKVRDKRRYISQRLKPFPPTNIHFRDFLSRMCCRVGADSVSILSVVERKEGDAKWPMQKSEDALLYAPPFLKVPVI